MTLSDKAVGLQLKPDGSEFKRFVYREKDLKASIKRIKEKIQKKVIARMEPIKIWEIEEIIDAEMGEALS